MTNASVIASAGSRALLDAENPWPGLDAYGEAAKDFFKGREEEAAEMLRLIRLSALTVVYGKSGLGKTSLLEAGLFPLLRHEHFLPVYLRLDFSGGTGTQPKLQPLEQAMERLTDSLEAVAADFPAAASGESLWEYLHHKKPELWSADNYQLTPVLVFDQFEELFSRSGGDRNLIKQVFDQLADLIENRIPPELASEQAGNRRAQLDLFSQKYRVVLSFREDFLPTVRVWEKQVPSLLRSSLRLGPMSRRCAIKAVEQAGEAVLDEGVAASIVDFVGEPDSLKRAGGSSEMAIEPVLLSLCCTQLNRSRAPGSRIDKTLLEGAGEGILEKFYRDAINDEDVKGQPDVAVFIEDKLIQGDYRGDYPKQEALDKNKITERQLTALTDRLRLLRIIPHADTARIELIHDRLVPVIAKARDERAIKERQREQELKATAAEAERDKERARSEDLARSLKAARRNRNIAVVTAILSCLLLLWGWKEQRSKEKVKLNSAVAVDTARLAEGRLALGVGREPLEQTMYRALAAYRLTTKESSQSTAASLTALHWVLENSGHLRKALTISNLQPTPALSYSPDGKTIAVGGEDGLIRLLDAVTYRELEKLDCQVPRGESVWTLAFNRDGKHLAAGYSINGDKKTASGSVCDFDLTHAATPRKWSGLGHAGKAFNVDSVAFGGRAGSEFVVYGGSDGVLGLLDVQSGSVYRGAKQSSEVGAVALSPDGNLFAAGAGSVINIWNVDDFKSAHPKPPRELRGHSDVVEQIEFSDANPERLVSAGDDGRIIVWNTKRGCSVQQSKQQVAKIYSIALRPGADHVISAAGADGVVRLYRFSTEELPCVGIDANGIATKLDATSEIVENDSMLGHGGYVLGIAWNPDGTRLASAGQDGSIRIWGPANSSFAIAQLLLGKDESDSHGQLTKLAISPDGKTVAAGDDKGIIYVWNKPAESVEPVVMYADERWLGHNSAVKALSYVRVGDRTMLVSGGEDGALKRWDLSSGGSLIAPELGDGAGPIRAIAVSPDGKMLAAGSKDGVIRLWDVAAGVKKATFAKATDAGQFYSYDLYAVGFSADGKYLAVGDSLDSILIRDLAKDGQERRLTGQGGSVKAIAHGGDRWLLSAGGDGSLLEWEAAALTRVKAEGLRKQDEFRYRMGFRNLNALTAMDASQDGKWIITGGINGQVQLWDGTEHVMIGDHFTRDDSSDLKSVAIAPDASFFVTGGSTILVWPGPERWANVICSKLAANMSDKEWNQWISPAIEYKDQCPGLPRASQ